MGIYNLSYFSIATVFSLFILLDWFTRILWRGFLSKRALANILKDPYLCIYYGYINYLSIFSGYLLKDITYILLLMTLLSEPFFRKNSDTDFLIDFWKLYHNILTIRSSLVYVVYVIRPELLRPSTKKFNIKFRIH
jgi:hypothetical protein